MTNTSMNPKKQIIAIAKTCGWDYHNRHPIHGKQSIKSWYYRDSDITVSHESSLPDYLNDLNAMHKAEGMLQHYGYYCDQLAIVMKVNRGAISLISATAAQRAEAFLKALNLWKE